MKNTRLNELFQRNLQGSCSQTEQLELEALIHDQENAVELESLMNVSWELEPAHTVNKAASSRILNHILKQKTSVSVEPKFNWKLVFKAAAILLVFAGVAFWFRGTAVKEQPVFAQSSTETIQEHRFVKLPDGSTVVLNENSKLEYPVAFGKVREVTLTGEGYFDVKHDPDKAFIVHTGKIRTTVLGTAFNIRAYGSDAKVIVTVTRGKVSVQNEQRTLGIIIPNQQLVFDKIADQKVQLQVNAQQVINWQARDVFFDNITMEQAARQLERRFNVKIAFANDAVKNCRFTGTILNATQIESVLKPLCAFNSSEFSLKNEVYLISGAGCKD